MISWFTGLPQTTTGAAVPKLPSAAGRGANGMRQPRAPRFICLNLRTRAWTTAKFLYNGTDQRPDPPLVPGPRTGAGCGCSQQCACGATDAAFLMRTVHPSPMRCTRAPPPAVPHCMRVSVLPCPPPLPYPLVRRQGALAPASPIVPMPHSLTPSRATHPPNQPTNSCELWHVAQQPPEAGSGEQ